MNQEDIRAVQNAEAAADEARQKAEKDAAAIVAEGHAAAKALCEEAVAAEASAQTARLADVAAQAQIQMNDALEKAEKESEFLRLLAAKNAAATRAAMLAVIS